MSKEANSSNITTPNLSSLAKNRSRTNLTNAEHHVMKVNYSFLANKISEMPHHYFTVEHTTPRAKIPSYVKTQLSQRGSKHQVSILSNSRRPEIDLGISGSTLITPGKPRESQGPSGDIISGQLVGDKGKDMPQILDSGVPASNETNLKLNLELDHLLEEQAVNSLYNMSTHDPQGLWISSDRLNESLKQQLPDEVY